MATPLTFLFINPNPPQNVAQALGRILLESKLPQNPSPDPPPKPMPTAGSKP